MAIETQHQKSQIHIAMYPLFAHSHITSFLHLANKLAQKGCTIYFFLPSKTLPKHSLHNHHPDLITLIPIPVPHVDGLPEGCETTDQVPARSRGLIMAAMDRTQDLVQSHLASLKPDFVFHDFAYWVPNMARRLGIMSVYYSACYMVYLTYISYHARNVSLEYGLTGADLMDPPPCFPAPVFGLHAHEAQGLAEVCGAVVGDEGLTMLERYNRAIKECDALAVRTCREMEGEYCDFFEKCFGKPVLPTGLLVRTPAQVEKLEEGLENWFKGVGEGSVVYCAIGSEWVLEKDQFQELLLGLELTGRPFLAVLRTPEGYDTLESAIPDGFKERTKGRGIVQGGWVQQHRILHHPAVGCFVTHCGAASLSEAMGSHCQLVFMPFVVDQQVNARMLSLKLKVGVEIETQMRPDGQTDGLFTRDAVCKAIETVMDDEGEIANEVRANHANLRRIIMGDGFEESYINGFVHELHSLLEVKKHVVDI